MENNLQNIETWNLILTTYKKEITEINPNVIEIMAPYRFPMRSWSGLGASTLIIVFTSVIWYRMSLG